MRVDTRQYFGPDQRAEYIAMTKYLIREFRVQRKRAILRLIIGVSVIVGIVALAASMELGDESMESVATMASVISGTFITVFAIPKINWTSSALKAAKDSLQEFENGKISIEDYGEKYLGEMIGYLGLSREYVLTQLWEKSMGRKISDL